MGALSQNEKPTPRATGFLVRISNIPHLVTAKHVVFDSRRNQFIDSELYIFLNTTSGQIQFETISDIKKEMHCNWIFHENDGVDIAIIPLQNLGNGDALLIPDNLFQKPEELYENLDVFFLSYQPGIDIKQKASPILRSGTISMMNEDATFLIDATSFPGNSGSPVFLKPSMILNEAGDYLASSGGKLIGVIGGALQYRDVAVSRQTGNERIAFEENMGLSIVWSVRFLNDLIVSEPFKDQISRMPPNQK